MKIKITETSKQPMPRYDRRRTTPHMYFFIDGESIMDNLANRRSRPHLEFKKMISGILLEMGLTQDQVNQIKPSWSQQCGCSCGCSPGFRLKGCEVKENFFITVKIEA